MKQTYLALFLLFTLAIASCRKSGNEVDIKTYNSNQIRDYIAANGLSAMKRDTVGGDTSGIYYQITRQGKGAVLNYDTRVIYVYSVKSLDGKFLATDTIAATIQGTGRGYVPVGLIGPKGLMMAIHNVIKNKGTTARILVPSRLAYGVSGLTAGVNRISGNESLDYTINILDDDNTAAMVAYDDLSIRKYCSANNIDINSYTKKQSGLYVKVTQAGNGTSAITSTSTASVQYLGLLLNNNPFDNNNTDTGLSIDMQTVIAGWQEGLLGLTAGAKVDLLIPSKLGYGINAQTRTSPTTGQQEVSIPTTSCLRFGINILTVTN
jgi:FKBP-type peptidyl-prolyl cis-trans isomerase FkpA